jgi:hypothetical protein
MRVLWLVVLVTPTWVEAKNLTLRQRTTTSGTLASTQEFTQYWVGSRIVNDGRGSRVLFDLDAGTMTMVDKRGTSYYTQTFAEVREQADSMTADAQKALEKSPPEVRATRGKAAVSVKRTGKAAKIAGYLAREYAFAGGGVTGSIWVTDALTPPGGSKAHEAFSRMMGLAPPGAYVAEAIAQIPGVPLRTTFRSGGDAKPFQTTTEVVEVSEKDPPADVTNVPEGFAKVESPFDRMRASQKGAGHPLPHGRPEPAGAPK